MEVIVGRAEQLSELLDRRRPGLLPPHGRRLGVERDVPVETVVTDRLRKRGGDHEVRLANSRRRLSLAPERRVEGVEITGAHLSERDRPQWLAQPHRRLVAEPCAGRELRLLVGVPVVELFAEGDRDRAPRDPARDHLALELPHLSLRRALGLGVDGAGHVAARTGDRIEAVVDPRLPHTRRSFPQRAHPRTVHHFDGPRDGQIFWTRIRGPRKSP